MRERDSERERGHSVLYCEYTNNCKGTIHIHTYRWCDRKACLQRQAAGLFTTVLGNTVLDNAVLGNTELGKR